MTDIVDRLLLSQHDVSVNRAQGAGERSVLAWEEKRDRLAAALRELLEAGEWCARETVRHGDESCQCCVTAFKAYSAAVTKCKEKP